MNKFTARNIVNRQLGYSSLNPNNGGNVCWANINAAKDVWWVDIPIKKFTKSLHLILNDERKKEFYWISINENKINNPYEYFSKLGEKFIRIEISSREADKFVDVKSGGTRFDFRTFNIERFDYPN